MVEEITLPDGNQGMKEVVRNLYDMFSAWGEVVDIHFDSQKCVAYIKYKHRHFAEFGKEAMQDQPMGATCDPIWVKWSTDNPFDKEGA